MQLDPAIDVRNLTARYGDTLALDEISLQIHPGDFVGIVGPNGSGKTTLLRTILGLKSPAAGSVRIYGECPGCTAAYRRVGYVPQNATQTEQAFPASALEIVLLGRVGQRGLLRRLTGQDRRIAREALDRVGVADLADRPIGELSGGQRQRVFLAKALASRPDLLILDEPTTGVDPQARESFYNLIDRLNHDDGLTIVLVSHDTQVMQSVAHRVVVLNQRLLFDGTPSELEAAGGFDAFYDLHVHHGGEACDHPL